MRRGIDILLVEDNPGDIELTKRALNQGRLLKPIGLARNGVEALAYLRQLAPFEQAARPDLVLLDLNLPQLSGLAVLEQMKADPKLRSIPVVVLTTSAHEDDVRRAYEFQASGFITKPVDLNRFVEVIESFERYWFEVCRLPGETLRHARW